MMRTKSSENNLLYKPLDMLSNNPLTSCKKDRFVNAHDMTNIHTSFAYIGI